MRLTTARAFVRLHVCVDARMCAKIARKYGDSSNTKPYFFAYFRRKRNLRPNQFQLTHFLNNPRGTALLLIFNCLQSSHK